MEINRFTKNVININTYGGYTYEQVMNNKNCSKNPKYWYAIENTLKTEQPRYLFKSRVAESWEFFDKDIINPIRNTNQIYLRFLDIKGFTEPSNHYREHGTYSLAPPDTMIWNRYWDDLEDKIENGFEIAGVRITGRHFFLINFGRFRAIPVDEFGRATSTRKIWTFLRFLDHQYYMMNELEECLLEGPYKHLDIFKKWFPEKTTDDFELLKLESFALAKGRRKGWTANIAIGVFNYNFTFLESSMSILAAYEKSHYGPMLSAIHTTKTFLDKNTPWKRRTDIKGTHDHMIAGIETMDAYGMKIKEGYLSEIQATSFKDNPFKGIGQCFKPNQLVINNLGELIEIQSLKIGDKLLGPDGKDRIVKNIHRGKDLMTTFSQKKGVEFTVNSKHLLYGENSCGPNKNKIVKCSTEEFLKYPKYKQEYFKTIKSSGVTFSEKEYRLDPYFIGLWLGDGTTHKAEITTADTEIERYLEKIAKKFGLNLIYQQKKKNKAKGIRLTNHKHGWKVSEKKHYNPVLEILYDLEILHNKKIPRVIKTLSKQQRLEFLAGFIDSDGSLSKNGKYYEIYQKDETIVDDLIFIIRSLGFSVTKIKRVRGRFIGFRLFISGDIWNIPVKIKRKKTKEFEISINNILHSSIKVKDQYYGDYVGIEVSGDHLFLLEDFTIVHNSADIINIEEAGKFDRLLETYPISIEPLIRDGETMIGIAIAGGTAGDMESGGSIGLSELMTKPKHYGFKNYDNIYEANDVPGESGWFIDDLWYSPLRIKKEKILELDNSERTKELLDKFSGEYIETVDNSGNSYRYLSELILNDKREKRRKISTITYQKFITQQPKYLSEAFLLNESSPFDTATAKEVLGQLEVEKIGEKRGVFSITEGKPRFRLNMDLVAVDEFPFKGKDTTGCWVLYEDPVLINGKIPPWRYIAGCDPIDWGSEESSSTGSHSLAATYIIDTVTRNIVAEYISRPRKAEDYFEQLWRGLDYYNAFLLYENNLKSLFSYFKLKNKLYLLSSEPESLKSRWGYKASRRTLGFHATAQANSYARELIHTWSLEEVPMNQTDDGEVIYLPRMYFIKSKGLLQEIILWNSKGNFDRISSLGATMILLYDREYDTDDEANRKESIMDKGIFLSMRNIINNKNKFNFKIDANK